ncbi:hypothetical protein P7K49_014394, partial [Saguinus oedipus]
AEDPGRTTREGAERPPAERGLELHSGPFGLCAPAVGTSFPRESARVPAQLPPYLCPGRPSPAITAHLSPSLRSAQPTPPAPCPTLPGRTRRAPKSGRKES